MALLSTPAIFKYSVESLMLVLAEMLSETVKVIDRPPPSNLTAAELIDGRVPSKIISNSFNISELSTERDSTCPRDISRSESPPLSSEPVPSDEAAISAPVNPCSV